MQKKIFLIVINLLLLTNIYALNKQDSIFHDLFQLLVLRGDMPKDMDWVLNCENSKCKQYLYVFNILKDTLNTFPNQVDFINIPFGIYKFQYNGCIDCGYYVLIKNNESYKIYYQNNVTNILRELIKIRKENPDLISDDMYTAYIEAIIDDELGIYGGRSRLVQQIGHIEYYH